MVIATHATIEELDVRVRAFVDGWNAHDPDRVLAETSDDVIWKAPATATLVGYGPVRKDLERLFRAFPDLHLHDLAVHVAPDGESAVATWRLTATMQGRLDPPGFSPTGRAIELVGACLYAFRDGAIARHTIVYDGIDFLRQLGALPKGDLMAVLMQRTATWWKRRREH
jgi:steroid delta-isomerase-like uncharacterized protein